jgi:hypothetical protein
MVASGPNRHGSYMTYEAIHQYMTDTTISDGTMAACFLSGIEAGLFADDLPKEWAFKVIEDREQPPIEVIEVATAQRRSDLCEALKVVRGSRDLRLAGRILLRHIYTELAGGTMSVWIAASSAERVTRTMSFPERVYFDFMALHEQLHLAHDGVYGTVPEVMEDLLASLRLNIEPDFC